MADKIIPNLPKSEAPTFDDLMLVVDTPASTPTNKKVTLKNLFNKVPTTIGYGTETVSSVDVSDTTQALDDKALFICTAIGTQDRIATMSDGNHVGQTTTIVLVASSGTTTTYVQLEDGTGNLQMEWGYSQIQSSVDMIILEVQVGFKITPNNFLDHTGGSNTKVSLPNIGDSATLMWTGSKWIVTSFVGSAVTST